jgi:ketol-acid reductoisomerase
LQDDPPPDGPTRPAVSHLEGTIMKILRERDCPPDPIRGLTIGVLGYGNQGRAQAWNLRESGCAVVVGARPEGHSADLASAEGFTVVASPYLADMADLVAVLLPDEVHAAAVSELAVRARRGGRIRTLIFAHGYSLCYEPPSLDPAWDVAVVAPSGPGVQVRSRFEEGRGVPAFLAVYRDPSGEADGRARAYAAAIGCARAGLMRITVSQEAEIDLFGEQAVLCGGMNALCRAAFDILVDAGYPPEAAYLECVQQVRLTAELLETFGLDGMRRRISPAALYGDLTRGPRIVDAAARARMREILEEVRSGEFAREWRARREADPGWRDAELSSAHNARFESCGETARTLHGIARPEVKPGRRSGRRRPEGGPRKGGGKETPEKPLTPPGGGV